MLRKILKFGRPCGAILFPNPKRFFVGEWRPAKKIFFLNMWGIMRSVCGVDMRANGDVIVALGLLKENITSGVVIIKNKTN